MQNLPESKLPCNLEWICEKCLEGKGDAITCAWRGIDGELCPELSKLIYDLGEKRNPWISIKAGLPKSYKLVDVVYNGCIDSIGYYSAFSKQWYLFNDKRIDNVSHWKYRDGLPEVEK